MEPLVAGLSIESTKDRRRCIEAFRSRIAYSRGRSPGKAKRARTSSANRAADCHTDRAKLDQSVANRVPNHTGPSNGTDRGR